MNKLPLYAVDLIAELDKAFPQRNPEVGQSMDLIMHRAGQRSVIEHLLSRIKTSEDNILRN